MNTLLANAEDLLLDRINQICSRCGLNNIMAQLYTILYLSDKPLSLNDMVERLKISKGSASINMRALERYGVVKQVWVKGSRKDYYEAESDIYKVVISRIRSMVNSRFSEIDEMIKASYEALNYINATNEDDEAAVKVFKAKMERLDAVYRKAKSFFELFEAALSHSEATPGDLEELKSAIPSKA